MVKLVQTDRIQSALQTLVDARGEQRSRLPLELLTAIQDHLDDEGGTDVEKDAAAQRASWVEHRLLAHISRWNRSTGVPDARYSLRELMRGTDVYVQPPTIKQRAPELEAILAPIRLANERAVYSSLVASSSSLPGAPTGRNDVHTNPASHWDFTTAAPPSLSVKQEWDAARRELSAVANVLASMAAVATAVWWAAGDTPLVRKVLLSLFGALAIAAIEGFLYMRFFTRLAESKQAKPTPKSQRSKIVFPPELLALAAESASKGSEAVRMSEAATLPSKD